jgi:hypothetical protein
MSIPVGTNRVSLRIRRVWNSTPYALRLFLAILLVNALLVATWAAVDAVRSRSFVTRARSINVGDSNEQVTAIMGSATTVFTPPQEIPRGWYFGVRVETWAYGKVFDWQDCFYSEFPYFFPFKFRLFGPDPERDVKIEFDSTGRVELISLPTTYEKGGLTQQPPANWPG